MEFSFRQYLSEQMVDQGAFPMPGTGVGAPDPATDPNQKPDWNALAYELGIEPEDMEKTTMVSAWTGPDNIHNLGAFTIQGVNKDGEKINGVEVEFLPVNKHGTKSTREMSKTKNGWRVVPKSARLAKNKSKYMNYDWLNKVLFQHQNSAAPVSGPMGGLPGPGGMPMGGAF
jgi:hypothetical protein